MEIANPLFDHAFKCPKDEAEEIDTIIWNVGGKIMEIRRTAMSLKSDLEFRYDAMGNRVVKIVKPSGLDSTDWVYTYYIRDAEGNMLTTQSLKADTLKGKEFMIYGSSRLGVLEYGENLSSGSAEYWTMNEVIEVERGRKGYELSNHLGNVLVTLSDRKV